MQSEILLVTTALSFIRAQIISVSFVRVRIRAVPLTMRDLRTLLVPTASGDNAALWRNFYGLFALNTKNEPRLDALSAIEGPQVII